ncbi:MAG TPA: T9SS type A sorting domain-containing protein [Lutibacter sp.]|nr:T9SS type A sorting domain-containing protein [Lutibacter sp.]
MRFILLTLFVFIQLSMKSQSAPILIDGVYDDWNTGLATFTDTAETISGIDILEMQVTNDDAFLYIKFITDTEFDLTTNLVQQDVMLFIDADNNPTTGYQIQSGYGSELGINFKERFAYYNVTPPSNLSFSDIRLIPAPTVTSNQFEIAIARNVLPDGINPLFPSPTIRILFKDANSGDNMPNVGEVFYYTFDESAVPDIELIEIEKADTSLIRILAYNTLFSGLIDTDRVNYFENIIRVLNPDIIGFSECGSTSSSDVKTLLDDWLPLGTSQGWYVTKDSSGDLITASRWQFLQQWNSLYRQFPVLIDLPASYNTNLLFTNAHLRCCDANYERQEQVDDYVSFMLDAMTSGGEISLPENTPFVYAGDLNLVGFAQQLTTLITGDIQNTATYGTGGPYDWDSTSVTDQICRQTDKRMAYTWRDDGSSFPDGRLDFMLFSDAVMTAEKSFTLQTEVMSTDRLQQYGFYQYDTSTASDHFPVVTDFSIHAAISVDDESLPKILLYPNPTKDKIKIDFINPTLRIIKLFDIKGLLILEIKSDLISKEIDVTFLNKGVYFISVENSNGAIQKLKFIKI